jgi:hypothetical protein
MNTANSLLGEDSLWAENPRNLYLIRLQVTFKKSLISLPQSMILWFVSWYSSLNASGRYEPVLKCGLDYVL